MSERKSSHSPGAQGHDDTLRKQIAKLQRQTEEMLGNNALPNFVESTQQESLTTRLYDEQAPRDYGRRKITGYSRGKNSGRVRRGDAEGPA